MTCWLEFPDSTATSQSDPVNCPLSKTDVIWRYMRWSAFFLLLLKRQIFFPSIETLNTDDPWEGHCKIGSLLFEDAIEQGSNQHQKKLAQWLVKNAENFEKKWIQRNHAMAAPSVRRDIYFRNLAKMRAVCCWHRARDESALMWTAYGAAGVAVRTTVEKLLAFLPTNRNFLLSPIQYFPLEEGKFHSEFRPDSDHSELILRPYLIKGLEFAHEQEIRVVTNLDKGLKGTLVQGNPVKEFLDEVVISLRINSKEAEALKEEIASIIKRPDRVQADEIGRHEALSTPEPLSPLEQNQQRASAGSEVRHSHLSGPVTPDGYEAFAQEMKSSIPNRKADRLPWPLDIL